MIPGMFEDLAVIIPYRPSDDPWREEATKWVQKVYRQFISEKNLFYCDSDPYHLNMFSRGGSRNLGAILAREYDYYLIADADTLPFYNYIDEGFSMLKDGANWVIPYGTPNDHNDAGYYNLTEKSSHKIIQSHMYTHEWKASDIEFEHHLVSWAGQLLITKEAFEAVNGYDERFIGWGYEDNAFRAALDTIVGAHERVEEGRTMHLWHPAPIDTTWESEFIQHNRALWTLYVQREGNKLAMSELVKRNQ